MRSRSGLVELFSSFLLLASDSFDGWLIDPKLRRSMELNLKDLSDSTNSEKFWVIFWHKQWQEQSHSLSQEHLCAYLQESCYWSTQQTIGRFSNIQYKLSDGFQIAIASIDKVLTGFDQKQGNSLKNYASQIFRSILTNTLRQRKETDICSDWALLRKVSKKRLKIALEKAGLTNQEIEQYRLAWRCFLDIYTPKSATVTQQISRPDQVTWQKITELYNQQRLLQSKLIKTEATSEILEQWLKKCAKSIRSYLYPQTTSLNVTNPNSESRELIDNLATSEESLLDTVMIQEEVTKRQDKHSKISQVLTMTLEKLSSEEQTILQLYYGEKTNQTDIAKQLRTKQYTVSRRLTKGRKNLLKALTKWSQNEFNISITSEGIEQMSGVLGEWLEGYYDYNQ